MFLHPVDYGRKAEELLWRKVYYEVIQVIKTNKKVTEHEAGEKYISVYVSLWVAGGTTRLPLKGPHGCDICCFVPRP